MKIFFEDCVARVVLVSAVKAETGITPQQRRSLLGMISDRSDFCFDLGQQSSVAEFLCRCGWTVVEGSWCPDHPADGLMLFSPDCPPVLRAWLLDRRFSVEEKLNWLRQFSGAQEPMVPSGEVHWDTAYLPEEVRRGMPYDGIIGLCDFYPDGRSAHV